MTRIISTFLLSLLLVSGGTTIARTKKNIRHAPVHHTVAKKKISKEASRAKSVSALKKKAASIAENERSLANAPRIEHDPIALGYDPLTDEDISQEVKDLQQEDDIKVNVSDLFNESRDFSPKDMLLSEDETNPLVSRSDVMMTVIDWLGTPYRFGGSSRRGIDCSAFIQTIYRDALGLEIPRSASMQYGEGISVKRNDLAFGDLLFFHTRSRIRASHVGMYLGNGLFAQSGASSGVTISSLESTYFAKRYIGAKRIVVPTMQTALLK